MLAAAVLAWTATAAAAGCSVVDVGTSDDGEGPLAVVVETPGFAPVAFESYVTALEGRGVDVVALRLPLSCHDPALLRARVLPHAIAGREGRPTAVVAHGWAGSLVVDAVAALKEPDRPAAVALVGTPLRWEARSVWHPIFAALQAGQDWALPSAHWRGAGSEAQALLLGSAELPLAVLGAPFVEALQAWQESGRESSTAHLGLPVYAAAADLDRLAPVESIRPLLGPRDTFVRHGRASLLREHTDHSFLLTDPRPPAALATWVSATLRSAP